MKNRSISFLRKLQKRLLFLTAGSKGAQECSFLRSFIVEFLHNHGYLVQEVAIELVLLNCHRIFFDLKRQRNLLNFVKALSKPGINTNFRTCNLTYTLVKQAFVCLTSMPNQSVAFNFLPRFSMPTPIIFFSLKRILT